MFQVRKYMEGKTQLTPGMRAILIDWLVEIQENFELYHETLYLAVRIVDLFLQEKDIDKTKLQLVGATAMLIASKIEVSEHISIKISSWKLLLFILEKCCLGFHCVELY